MRVWQWALVGLLISLFVLLSYLSAKQESLTYDEIVYTQEGTAIFFHGNFSIDPYNPPFIKEILHFGGRGATIVLGSFLLLAVFLVAKSYFGIPQAFFALFLLIFEPNILGNSHYVTLDTGFTLFFFLCYIFFLRCLRRPSATKNVMLGLSLGALLASKITAVPYFFISAIVTWLWKQKKAAGYRKQAFFVLVISASVVWSTYFFTPDVIVVKHDDPNRVSSRIISYAKNHKILPLVWVMERLQNQKLPLGTYISVIKNNVIRNSRASKVEPWYTMIKNVVLKTPLPLLLFFFLSMRKRIFLFLIPIAVILVTASLSRMSPLVRYVLPIYPFMAVVAGRSLKEFRGIYRNVLFVGLVVWYAVGTVSQFPHFISYANELAGPREKRYEKFTDSNIDWGQGLISLQNYIAMKKPKKLLLSYFGRDAGNRYGFASDKPWGSYKFEEICAFHNIDFSQYKGRELTAISISNWYSCGYSNEERFAKEYIIDVVGDSILIFR